ncbi:hypothetical protein Glove_541g22 [Diversispora epigaea]|uniref:Palmitoyltransferase n=1 Tax=Diversispora epigaea TaxID=1348612 RepID=A0A397GG93_9GLOM|nr:hypothetical protein Glove_541g22 [Diversispora epigaea]
MDPFVGIAIYLGIFSLLIFILLMGPSPRFRNGIIGKLNYLLTVALFKWLGITIRKVLGNRVSRMIDGIYSYCMEQKNPVLPLVFLTLMTGSVYTFFVAGWHYVPGPYVSKIHIYIIPLIIAFTYLSFIIACYSDPGRIAKENVVKACKMFEYDFLIFEPRKCRTCLFPKPARSKHCSLCKMCVAKSDHHCAWINNCVGLKNYRYFILFLYSIMQICFYGTYIILCIFCGIAKNMNLSSALVKNPKTGVKSKVSYHQMALLLIHHESFLGILGIFIVLVGIVISVFLGYQFYLIFSGFTSNESLKWSDVEELIMDEELWVYDRKIEPKSNDDNNKSRKKKNNNDNVNKKDISIEGKEKKLNNNNIRGIKTYWIKPNNLRNRQNNQNSNNEISERSDANNEHQQLLSSTTTTSSSSPSNEFRFGKQVKSISEVKNIYDKGKWKNLLEVLFPPSL